MEIIWPWLLDLRSHDHGNGVRRCPRSESNVIRAHFQLHFPSWPPPPHHHIMLFIFIHDPDPMHIRLMATYQVDQKLSPPFSAQINTAESYGQYWVFLYYANNATFWVKIDYVTCQKCSTCISAVVCALHSGQQCYKTRMRLRLPLEDLLYVCPELFPLHTVVSDIVESFFCSIKDGSKNFSSFKKKTYS